MIDTDIERFDIRATTQREMHRHAVYAKNMLFAASAASLAIVGAGAYLLSLL